MSTRTIVGLLLLSLAACGENHEFGEAAGAEREAGHYNLMLHELTDRVLETELLSHGLPGRVPQWDSAAVFGGMTTPLAPQAAPDGGTRLLQQNYAAVSTLSLEEISCTTDADHGVHTVTKADYGAHDEERSAAFSIAYRCEDGQLYVKQVDAEIAYRDGGHGTLLVTEADEEGRDGDLLTGFAALHLTRSFPQGDDRKQVDFLTVMSFGGALVDPPSPRTWKQMKMAAEMRSGARVKGVFTPDAPVKEGSEASSGSMTHTVDFPGGTLARMTAEGAFSARDVGFYEVVREYRDGSTVERFRLEGDGKELRLDEERRDGTRRSGSLLLSTGEFSTLTRFPSEHERFTMTERGQWATGDSAGKYQRTIQYRHQPKESTLDVTLLAGAHRLTAEFTSRDADGIWFGTVLTTNHGTLTHSDILMTNRRGDEVSVSGVRYPDGSSEQHYVRDLIETRDVNPDEKGSFRFSSDGSAMGELTVYAPDFHASGAFEVFDVTIDPHGGVESRKAR